MHKNEENCSLTNTIDCAGPGVAICSDVVDFIWSKQASQLCLSISSQRPSGSLCRKQLAAQIHFFFFFYNCEQIVGVTRWVLGSRGCLAQEKTDSVSNVISVFKYLFYKDLTTPGGHTKCSRMDKFTTNDFYCGRCLFVHHITLNPHNQDV